jgi:hypothetical protein
MDEHTKENWHKIKKVLEDAGKTDCMFYRRALSIISTGEDPLNHFLTNHEPKRD